MREINRAGRDVKREWERQRRRERGGGRKKKIRDKRRETETKIEGDRNKKEKI